MYMFSETTDLTIMNLSGNTRLLIGGDEMNMKEKLASLPYSYDDFVRFTMQCIEREDGVKEAIDRQFQVKPDSDTNDITKVVVDFLGLGEPFELVDDDDEVDFYADAVETATLSNGMARLARI